MGRRRHDRKGSHGLFGMTGWLFADLFVALTAAFLVANTVGQLPAAQATTTPTPTPTVFPTPTVLPALDLQPISVTIQVDYQGILNNNPAAVANAEQQLRTVTQLRGRRAGLVLSFGGTNGVGTQTGLQIADQFNAHVLTDLGTHNYVFIETAYRSFFSLGSDPSQLSLDVYVFKNT